MVAARPQPARAGGRRCVDRCFDARRSRLRFRCRPSPQGAWRDLPSLQRTLAEPLRPVAVGDDFRQSLASFNDPSFVAPLSHQVDPSTGGLVDGLAAPGQPYAHPNGSDLPVPARPAAPAAPRVQRSVAWSGSTDLPTVGWELPGLPADEPVRAESRIAARDEQSGRTAGAGSWNGSASRSPAPDPVRSPADPSQAPLPVQRSLAAVPTTPGADEASYRRSRSAKLPVVVARSTPDVATAEMPAPEVRRRRCAGRAGSAGWSNPRPSRPRSADSPRRSPVWVVRTRLPADPPAGSAGDDRPVDRDHDERRRHPIGNVPECPRSESPSAGSPSSGSSRHPDRLHPDRRRRRRRRSPALPVVSRLADPARPGDQGSAASVGDAAVESRRSRPPSRGCPDLGYGSGAETARRPACPADRPNRTPGGTSCAAGGVPGPAGRDCRQRRRCSRIPAVAQADPESLRRARHQSPYAGESPSSVAAPSRRRPRRRCSGSPGFRPRRRSQRLTPEATAPSFPVVARGPAVRRTAVRTRPADVDVRWTAAETPDPVAPGSTGPVRRRPHRLDADRAADLGGPASPSEPWVATPGPAAPPTVSSTSAAAAGSVGSGAVGSARLSRRRHPSRRSPAPAPFASAAPASAAYSVPAGGVEPDGRRRSADSGAAQRRPPHRSRFQPVVGPLSAGRFAPGGGKRLPGRIAYGREHVLREHVRVTTAGRKPARRMTGSPACNSSPPITAAAPSEPAGEAAAPPRQRRVPLRPRRRPEPRRPIWTRWPAGSTSRCRRDCGPNCGSTASEPG